MKTLLRSCLPAPPGKWPQACSLHGAPYGEPVGAAGNGIALLEPVMLGGTRQWLHIRGADRGNPLLLFLHGGPGAPTMGLAHGFQGELERHFVVVHWDQRGSGKSFSGTPPASMTVAQLQADTHELVLWLCRRFRREKIYLLGHSWGSHLGLHEARRHPENLLAYIGTGQMVDLVRQEALSHDFVAGHASAAGHRRALRALRRIGAPPYRDTAKGLDTKYSLLWRYGGMIEGETDPYLLVKAMLGAPAYSLRDIGRFLQGLSFSLQQLARNEGEHFWRLQAPDPAAGFEIPIFFISGALDRVAPAALVTEYAHALRAPTKQAYILEGAGHYAFFTDPGRFTEILVDILAQTRPQRHGLQALAV